MTDASADLTWELASVTSSFRQGKMYVITICSRLSAGRLWQKSAVKHHSSSQRTTTTTTTTIVLWLFWILSRTTRVSQYQKGKTDLDLLEQETVSGSVICWAICNAYSLRSPAMSPPVGDTWVHLIPHSTYPQSSSLHGAVKDGSRSEIKKRALPQRNRKI